VGCLGPNPAFNEPRESGTGSGGGSGTPQTTATSEVDSASEATGAPPDASCDASDPDLVVCFDFESLKDDVLIDGSMYGHDASATEVELVASPWGRAIATTEATHIEVPCFEACEAMDALTLEAHVRIEALPPSERRIGVIDNDLEYAITYSRGGLRCAKAGRELEGPMVPLGEWAHVACTYDGVHIRAYVDGVEVASIEAVGPVGGGDPSPIAVANTAPSWNEPFIGALDRIRVWRRARSAAEICDEVGC
jgi:hypothetical protein